MIQVLSGWWLMAMSQLMLEPALCIRHPSLEKTTIESAASLVSHIPGVQSVTFLQRRDRK